MLSRLAYTGSTVTKLLLMLKKYSDCLELELTKLCECAANNFKKD